MKSILHILFQLLIYRGELCVLYEIERLKGDNSKNKIELLYNQEPTVLL